MYKKAAPKKSDAATLNSPPWPLDQHPEPEVQVVAVRSTSDTSLVQLDAHFHATYYRNLFFIILIQGFYDPHEPGRETLQTIY